MRLEGLHQYIRGQTRTSEQVFDAPRDLTDDPKMTSEPATSTASLRSGQYRDGRNLSARFQLHQRFSTSRYPFHRWIFDHFAFTAGARILELGCGFGALWSGNADRIVPDWDITLSDMSFGMLSEARTNLASSGTFRFQQIDASAIPYRDGVFDAVIANHMLYHVPDLARTLAEIRRVLKPGGSMYATTVGAAYMRELDSIAERFVGIDPMTNNATRFGLESGLAALRSVFGEVRLEPLRGELVVTEAEPMVAYIRSMTAMNRAPQERIAEMSSYIEGEIRAHGAIRIATESGIFIATR